MLLQAAPRSQFRFVTPVWFCLDLNSHTSAQLHDQACPEPTVGRSLVLFPLRLTLSPSVCLSFHFVSFLYSPKQMVASQSRGVLNLCDGSVEVCCPLSLHAHIQLVCAVVVLRKIRRNCVRRFSFMPKMLPKSFYSDFSSQLLT